MLKVFRLFPKYSLMYVNVTENIVASFIISLFVCFFVFVEGVITQIIFQTIQRMAGSIYV